MIRKHFSRELGKLKKKILSLGALAEERVSMALKAIDKNDAELAQKIIKTDYEMDDEVDQIKNEPYEPIKHPMSEHPDKIGYLINLLLISRHLERLADHTTKIAEEVIYMIEGEIIRHAQYDQL